MSPSSPAYYEDISPSTRKALGILGMLASYGEFEEVYHDFKRLSLRELWGIAAREGPLTCKYCMKQLILPGLNHY
jgi:hypothetical protein